MERFVARQNVEHLRRRLAGERDPAKCARLEQLLAEAIAQVNQAERRAADLPRGLCREAVGNDSFSALVQFSKDRFDVSEVLYRARRFEPSFDRLPSRAEYERQQDQRRRAAPPRRPLFGR